MEMYASAAPILTKKNVSLVDVRRSVKFHPTVWGDYFLAYTPNLTEISVAEEEELERQKEKVRDLLAHIPDDSTLKIELIDAIQRLGVGYHFEKEIDKSLRYIHDTYPQYNTKDNDLRVVALRFRLLRQQGYHVPCDVFSKFIDDEGNFKKSLVNDVEGMLSLYEASNYGVDGEQILDKALEFSSSHLESLVHQMTNFLSTGVNEALKCPISKTLNRVGAKKFIAAYQKDESHNKILLNFAKMDFNKVQKVHQKELSDITRWWNDLDFTNRLPFARDRVVEAYFWILSVYFEPCYHIARRILMKVIAISSIIDDIYDIHGTFDELQLFTNIVQSGEINAVDQLPPYIRICYKALLGVYAEMEDEMVKVGKSYRVQYAKEEMKNLVKAYMQEAKWYFAKYIPTVEEYMKVALASCGYKMLSIISLFGMGDQVTKEDLDWLSSEPLIVQASSMICRLMDDIVGYGVEEKITVVDCCMKQNGVSDMEALVELRGQVKNAWKDINKECLEPRAASMLVLMRVVNLARVMHLLYQDEDGYDNSHTKTKDIIKSVLVEPVTI